MASSTGDVLLSAAMKRIGDLDEIRAQKGLLSVIGHVVREKRFPARPGLPDLQFLLPAHRALLGRRQPGGAGLCFAYVYLLRSAGESLSA